MSTFRGGNTATDERYEEEGIDVAPEEEEALLIAIEESEREELVPLADVVAQLRRR